MDTKYPIIEKKDLASILENHGGNKVFERTLRYISTTNHELLLSLLAYYIEFNSVFAPGVANLAGEIGMRKEIFRDSEESIKIIADRSAEVASKIFYAAIDEYARRETHRTLAQHLVKAAVSGYDSRFINNLFEMSSRLKKSIARVIKGYCLDQRISEKELFCGIGFHIGSEILADEEFRILNNFLVEHFQSLIRYLDEHGKSDVWIKIHTTVETEHFEAAVAGANIGLKFYSGHFSKEFIKKLILEGFEIFSRVQTQFMIDLEKEILQKTSGGVQ